MPPPAPLNETLIMVKHGETYECANCVIVCRVTMHRLCADHVENPTVRDHPVKPHLPAVL